MHDVIVVGAGGGGPVVAKELAARGLDVLLLEAGARNAAPEHDWTHFEIDQSNTISGVFRFGPADRTRPPWTRELAQNSLVGQVAGVGGTTQQYYANSPRAMPGVFAGYAGADAAAYDRAHEFPFGYGDLVPYYEWVEETLPVQTAAMGTKEEIFLAAAGKLGLAVQRSKTTSQDSYRPQENAILQPSGVSGKTSEPRKLVFPQAKGCTFCGYCVQGCMEPLRAPRNLKAKRSTDNSYVPMALTADLWAPGGKPITLIADAFAYRVETHMVGGQLVARGITWRTGATGESHTEEARVLVLAAGAIETPRLWLNSELPNPNGWVGRGLTDHYLDTVVGVMPFEVGTSKGPGSAARADFPGRGSMENAGGAPPATLASFAAVSDSGIAGFYNNGSPVGPGGADAVGRIVGRRLKGVLANVEKLLSVIVVTDDDVENQNRVALSSTFPPDEHGAVPLIEVHHRNRSARTAANREFLVQKAADLVRAAGALEVFRLNWAPYLVHIHSTMRMGASETDSVLDADAEARNVKRLFIADNSALPNGVAGVNPTLTTQALATRTAERIFQRYFGGGPWVSQTAPVSSIDPAVTKAVIERQL
jgi:choline dehydrogenase-like flavoprotein